MKDNDNTAQSVEKSLSIEEMKILSSVIGRIESSIYQKQGWLCTMITGLAVLLFTDKPVLCKEQFFAVAIIATVLFFLADAIQRVPVHRAIVRSKEVEKALRENRGLNSPLVSESLGEGKNILDFLKTAIRFRVWAPYLLIVGVVVVVYDIAP